MTAIATTNYTGLISDIMQTDIIYLNGSTNLWYDPYVNKIGTRDELNRKEPHITVPLMFTQSGTKPMTSIGLSVQYVDMYQRFKESDYICCIGDNIQVILVDRDRKKDGECWAEHISSLP